MAKTVARMDSKSGMGETVEGLRILNPEDSICYSEPWKPSKPGQDGFESTRKVNSIRLIGSNGEGLLFVYDYSPVAPPFAAFRIFGAKKSCQIPLSDEISISGYISGLNEKDSTLKLENDVLGIEVSAWCFSVIVPFKINMATDTKAVSRFSLAPETYDAKGRFLTLKVNEQARKDYYEEGAEVLLSAGLPFKADGNVKVPPFGKSEVLAVHLPIPEKILSSPAEILDYVAAHPDSMIVHVRLEGRTGWIRIHDVQKIGFPARG